MFPRLQTDNKKALVSIISSQNKTNLKKNLVYQIGYRLLLVITPVITSPYISRVLGPENVGVFSASYAYVNYFMLFCLLGIETYGNRCIAKIDDITKVGKTFWNIYYVQMLASITTILIYFFSLSIFFGYRQNIATLQSIWLFASLIDINWLFFGLQRFDVTVIRNLVIKIFTIVGIFVFVKTSDDLPIYVIIMSIGNFLGQVVLWKSVLKEIVFYKPDFEFMKGHFLPIVKLFFPVLAFSVFHILDKTMLDIFSDDLNSGCYYSVDRLINIPLNIVVGISTVMLPRITSMLAQYNHKDVYSTLSAICELIIIFACGIAFGLGAIADTFVPVFFGKGYDMCVCLIWISTPIIIIKSLSDFIRQQYLIPFENDNVYIKAVLYGAVINIGANFVLIPMYGAIGACLGTLIAEAIVLFYQIFDKKVEIDFINMFFKYRIYFFQGIVMMLFLRFFGSIKYENSINKLLFLIVIGVLIFILMVVFYGHKNKGSVVYKLLNNEKL